ncbi:integrase arm-type DNA-binding domain-containing protein [Pectobacterium brasiliense]|uniref:tyrosine-type recombinase/integrase n=1 Tax=Pectobacterium brasiliense TaxID=180957 RepID=UPI0019693D1D|nr:integrase arm-type DNA-binding domain-containing protein [Pectobacterium brasiliense]MBN3114975.1 integrase arm-type DNA-binding domain-containing protein [Pectobacterium brasiliense]
MALTDIKVRSAKPEEKPYKLTDGNGMFLLVHTNGSKYWRLRYRSDGKEKTLALGVYPEVSLSEARQKRDEARKLISAGVDPNEHKKAVKTQQQDDEQTFEVVARAWHADNKKWSESHAERILKSLSDNIFPAIGSKHISDLKTRDLLTPIKSVERSGRLEVAKRLKQRVTAIMTYAVQNGLIDGYKGREFTKWVINLSLLIFIRSSELRFARWPEIDFERALWTIPPEREPIPGVKFSERGSKMHTPHLVPLSRQALEILKKIREVSGHCELVFIGDHSPRKPVSEGTVNKALQTMGYDTKTEVCGHGFRTMACSSLIESGLWSRDAVERQMSHQERNGVRAAYIHKAEHLDERKLMLQWWADFLDANRERGVSPFDFGKLMVG